MPKKKCSAKDCSSDGTQVSNIPMFKFPRDLDRCGLWVRNSGNEKLLVGSSRKLCLVKFLCVEHFEENQFFDKFHKRLRRSAVPSIFLCAPLSDEVMSKFPVVDHEFAIIKNARGKKSIDNTLHSLSNQYNVFPLLCSRAPSNCSESGKFMNHDCNQNNFDTSNPTEDMKDDCKNVGDSVITFVQDESQCHHFMTGIPCDSSADDDIDVIVPESITYIEGPWSEPIQETKLFSFQIFDTPVPFNPGSEHIIIKSNFGKQCTDQPSIQILETDLNIEEHIIQQQSMSSDFADPSYEPKAAQYSSVCLTNCEEVSDSQNLVSSADGRKQIIPQSRELVKGAKAQVVFAVLPKKDDTRNATD